MKKYISLFVVIFLLGCVGCIRNRPIEQSIVKKINFFSYTDDTQGFEIHSANTSVCYVENTAQTKIVTLLTIWPSDFAIAMVEEDDKITISIGELINKRFVSKSILWEDGLAY